MASHFREQQYGHIWPHPCFPSRRPTRLDSHLQTQRRGRHSEQLKEGEREEGERALAGTLMGRMQSRGSQVLYRLIHHTWSTCNTGSGRWTRIADSRVVGERIGWCAMSRAGEPWNARSQTVAGSSKAISSASGQTSIGGPSQLLRANQPEIVELVGASP